jgi:hypothetical protein
MVHACMSSHAAMPVIFLVCCRVGRDKIPDACMHACKRVWVKASLLTMEQKLALQTYYIINIFFKMFLF